MRRLGRNLRARQLTQAVRNWLNSPDFFAPLTHSLLLTKGSGTATFTRATSGTCLCYAENAVVGASMTIQTIPVGIPRFEGARFLASNNTWSNVLSDGSAIAPSVLKGVMIESSSANLYLNSATLVTQNNSTTAQSYTVSFYGTGSITLSGSATGTLVGTGANNRVSLTVTASAGTLTSTVSGSVSSAQLEAKSFASSYIPTTTASLTRNADVLYYSTSGNVLNTVGTFTIETTPSDNIPNGEVNFLFDLGLNKGLGCAFWEVFSDDSSTRHYLPSWMPLKGVTYKIGTRYGPQGQRNWLNGTAGLNSAFSGSVTIGTSLYIGSGIYGFYWGGLIKNVKSWKRELANSDITKGTS